MIGAYYKARLAITYISKCEHFQSACCEVPGLGLSNLIYHSLLTPQSSYSTILYYLPVQELQFYSESTFEKWIPPLSILAKFSRGLGITFPS